VIANPYQFATFNLNAHLDPTVIFTQKMTFNMIWSALKSPFKALTLATLLLTGPLTNSVLAETVVIQLSEGHSLTGDLILEREDRLYVDLGFEVIEIPKSAVLDRWLSKESGEAPKEQLKLDDGFTTTRLVKNSNTVSHWVDDLGSAVVLVESPTGLGSGFFINADGYLITNEHVISGEHDISVTVFEQGAGGTSTLNRQAYEHVEIVAVSPSLDLALLHVQADKPFNYLPIGDSGELSQGDTVFAIGNPLGLERSVSEGIVSLRNRLIGGRLLIQTTAEINPGNSGGPLLNLYGEVIGVNNMKVVAFGAEGLGFAIPTDTLSIFINNRDAFAFDPRNPNNGFRYHQPPQIWIPNDKE